MKFTSKKAAAGLLALALVVGAAPANVGNGGLFGGTAITASAADVTWGDYGHINTDTVIDGNVTVSSGNYFTIEGDAVVVINGDLTLEAGREEYNSDFDDYDYDDTYLSIYDNAILIVNGDLNLMNHSTLSANSKPHVFVTGNINENGGDYYDDGTFTTSLQNISYENGDFYSGGVKYVLLGSTFMETEQTLADGEYVQTATKDDVYYARYVFVEPKSAIEGKSKGVFTAVYNDTEKTFDTTSYYTELTTGGIHYTPASEDSVIFVVTITGVPSNKLHELDCELSFDDGTQEDAEVIVPADPETLATNTKANTYTGTNVKISVNYVGDDCGFYLWDSYDYTAFIKALNGTKLDKIEVTVGWNYVSHLRTNKGTITINSDDSATISDINDTRILLTGDGVLQIKEVKVYFVQSELTFEGDTQEEEYKTLDIEGITIKYQDGMTWAEVAAVNDNLEVDGNELIYDGEYILKYTYEGEGYNVKPTRTIDPSDEYYWEI